MYSFRSDEVGCIIAASGAASVVIIKQALALLYSSYAIEQYSRCASSKFTYSSHIRLA